MIKKIKFRHALLAFCLNCFLNSDAIAQNVSHLDNQNVIGPSPTSAALAKYIDNPVSFYTGTPDISIPLFEIIETDFKLPIGLSYHAGGVKVDELSSNIGLGWTLNAGGLITRAVKGLPDDKRKGNCPEDFWGYHDGQGDKPDCSEGLFLSHNIHDEDLDYIHSQDMLTASNQGVGGNYSLHNFFRKYLYVYFFQLPSSTGYTPPSASPKLGGHFTNVMTTNQLKDTEPDVFYFNFCGFSGSFVFKVDNGVRTIHLLSDHDLQVTHHLNQYGELIRFVITDNKGVRYEFAEVEETTSNVTTTTIGSYSDPSPVHVYNEMKYNSSWYLTKIMTPQNNTIQFSYHEETYQYQNQLSSVTLVGINNTNPDTYNPNTHQCGYFELDNMTHLVGKRLRTILGTHARVTFGGGIERSDVYFTNQYNYNRPYSIGSVQMSYLGDNIVKKYQFIQDYFESPDNDNSYTGNVGASWMAVNLKRLRLRGIQELGSGNCPIQTTMFEYKYSDFPGYNASHTLPRRLSFQQDLWGYYNGATNNVASMIPELYAYPDMFTDSRMFSVQKRVNHVGNEFTLPGGNRLPNPALMDMGILKKIIHPTGGSTIYEYEPHSYKDLNNEFIGGGLRIKSIKSSDGVNSTNDIVRNYSYMFNGQTSGRAISIPTFANFSYEDYEVPVSSSHYGILTSQYTLRNTRRFSHPQSVLGSTSGSNIGYRKVTEYITGNGRTDYEFSIPVYNEQSNDLPQNNSSSDCSITENGTCDGLYEAPISRSLFPYTYTASANPPTVTVSGYPFKTDFAHIFLTAERPNYDWNRGKLLKKETFNQSGELLRTENYNYKILYRNGNSAPTKVYGLHFVQKGFRYGVSKYHYLSDVRKVLESKTITDYQPATGNSLVNTEQYKYESVNNANVTQITSVTSTGDELVTKLKYPQDYNVTGFGGTQEGITPLIQKGMISIPVEKMVYLKKGNIEYLKSSSLSSYGYTAANAAVVKREFKVENNDVLSNFSPSFTTGQFWDLNKDPRYEEQFKVNRYNDEGNPLEIEMKGGEKVAYIWGYNEGQYPIAKIVNATYSQVEAILSAAILKHMYDGYNLIGTPQQPIAIEISDQEVRTHINSIRSALPNALVSTYTYRPLIGMSSETSPNGTITYYEYDCFNRLSEIRDHDGNILKRYTYQIEN